MNECVCNVPLIVCKDNICIAIGIDIPIDI